MPTAIRLARADEVGAVREVERAAGQLFRTVGLDQWADAEPVATGELLAAVALGQLLVGVDGQDRPCGFALHGVIDGLAYLRELSVAPACAGHRLGAG